MANTSTQSDEVIHLQKLNESEKARYKQKISAIGGVDPYNICKDQFSSDHSMLPTVTYPDIVNYLIFRPSPYTADDLRCYKGLEAYNQFVNGFVRDVRALIINEHHTVIGRVFHSQRIREPPLNPWVIVNKDGQVLSGHCDCVAGLGETCTHVSALLFYIETTSRIRDSATVTEKPSYWKPPPSARDVTYRSAYDTDFSSSEAQRKILMTDEGNKTPGKRSSRTVPLATDEEFVDLFSKLKTISSKAAILRVVPGHSTDFIPTTLREQFPAQLTELYDKDFHDLSFPDLLDKCKTVDITVTPAEVSAVEQATREQADTKLWHNFRAGRITASRMRQVCHSKPDSPSRSLIQNICYPQSSNFTSAATRWGCAHEKQARKEYLQLMEGRHDNFVLNPSGFVIDINHPFIGASPDGQTSCDCCGAGVLEIKCPFCARHDTIDEYAKNPNSCLDLSGGRLQLKQHHQYMYQVQTQLHVCGVEFCDFVVWTEGGIHIERITRNCLMWNDIVCKAREFFTRAVLPELMCKHYSSPKFTAPDSAQSFCVCNGPEELDDMIACDNDTCKIVWYHLKCVKVKKVPKGKWWCPQCRRFRNKKE